MISAAQIAALFPRAAAEHQRALAERGPALFDRLGITGQRLHFLLAQLGHESQGLTRVTEGLNYRPERLMVVFPGFFPTLASAVPYANNPEKLANFVYAGRYGNGPPASGDGYRFSGRGYIQITWRENYEKIGRLVGLDLVANPGLAASPDHALEVACGFWTFKKLNAVTDTGDFTAVTRVINARLVGLDDRRAWLDKVIRVMALPARPAAVTPPAATVVAVQRALRARGFAGIGAADGGPGLRTMAAVAEFRRRQNLGPGGIDAALLAALNIFI